MNWLVDRRALTEYSALLFGAIVCSIFARIVSFTSFSLAVCLFVLAVLFAWAAVVRQLNSAVSYFPESIQRFIRWGHALTLELAAVPLLFYWRFATHWHKNRPAIVAHPGRPILLVHGYLNGGFVWGFHKNKLIHNGLGPIYTIDLGYPFHSIQTYAERVKEKASEIAEETGCPELTLIGHSMGGLVSYYYAAKLARAYSVPQVITIGSPLQGTKVAKIGLGRCAREMQTHSDLIENLRGAVECCTDVQFYNIATQTDELIMPYTSSIFKSEPSRQYCLDDIGHTSLLFSKRVSQKLCEWLKNP